MCILCQGLADEFDVEHMKVALQKLSIQERKEKAQDIKMVLKEAENNRIPGDEWAVDHLRQAQYFLSQYL